VEPADDPAKVVTSPSTTTAAASVLRGWEDKEQRARERAKGPEKQNGTGTSIAQQINARPPLIASGHALVRRRLSVSDVSKSGME
jgi:hypothetical protein